MVSRSFQAALWRYSRDLPTMPIISARFLMHSGSILKNRMRIVQNYRWMIEILFSFSLPLGTTPSTQEYCKGVFHVYFENLRFPQNMHCSACSFSVRKTPVGFSVPDRPLKAECDHNCDFGGSTKLKMRSCIHWPALVDACGHSLKLTKYDFVSESFER